MIIIGHTEAQRIVSDTDPSVLLERMQSARELGDAEQIDYFGEEIIIETMTDGSRLLMEKGEVRALLSKSHEETIHTAEGCFTIIVKPHSDRVGEDIFIENEDGEIISLVFAEIEGLFDDGSVVPGDIIVAAINISDEILYC